MFSRNQVSSKENLLIPKNVFNKYNAKTCLMITFTPEGLRNLNTRYACLKGLPGFINNFLHGRYTPDRELILKNEKLCFWSCNYRFMIKPGGPNNDQEALLLNHQHVKNMPGGLALVGWVIDPRLFKRYSWTPSRETFGNFLARKNKPLNGSTYNYLKRTISQEGISLQEHMENPYLASILDFTFVDIEFLKDIKKTSLLHITEIYGVNPDEDQVDLFFHFPYGEDTSTVHLHIRINQGRHPLEMTRSISLDKIIWLLENKMNIADFIADNNPYFMENSLVVLNALNGIEGVYIKEIDNPLLLDNALTNTANNLAILQKHILQTYLEKGTLIMKLKLEDFDKRIETLTIKEIIEKTLSINIALKNYFPDTPDFRNPVIQGFAAWIIMYEYLSQNKDRLTPDVQQFLQGNESGKVNIFDQLTKTSDALKKNFKALIREDINKLNEAEIMKRSTTGRINHYYNETEKSSILSLLEKQNLVDANHTLTPTFYLLYRPRDGRFFCVPDCEIDLTADLNLSPIQYADLSSTHININEGLNCSDIFEKNFKDDATDVLPCKINSKDFFLYCGLKFNDVQIDREEMYRLELYKNAAICEANILRIKGPINSFKQKYNFPELQQPVPLHINIGVVLRKAAEEVLNAKADTVLDFIENSIFAESLKKAMEPKTLSVSVTNRGLGIFQRENLSVENVPEQGVILSSS